MFSKFSSNRSFYHWELRISGNFIARGNLLIAGNLVEDIVVRPVERIDYGRTIWVDSIEQHLGGNGSNTSYTLAKLGVPVSLIGAVGPDAFGDHAQRHVQVVRSFGDRLLAQLAQVGVNLDRVQKLDGPTAATVVLVAPDGSRSFLHQPGVSHLVFDKPIEFEGQAGHFHLANIFSLPQMRRTGADTLANARAAGWTTSLDTGHDSRGEWMKILKPCLPYIDLFFANEAESEKLTDLKDIRGAARVFLESGVKTVVIKRGSNGCAVFNASGEQWAAAYPVQAIDTTGAGDCFTGGFLAALWRGGAIEDAARLGNACGALSASKMGSITGLLTYSETVDWMRNVNNIVP